MSSRTRSSGTLYRDAVTLMLIGFIAMVIWMLPYINPPVDADKMEPPGSIIATIVWPEGNSDVDLWVDGPAEPKPVGYSNKGGLLWNLLRDDLGRTPDATPLNFEHAFTRGIVPGEYRINAHCYRCPEAPIEVSLEVSIKSSADSKMKTIGTSTIMLNTNHEEKTGLAFTINESDEVVPESLNTVYSPLRGGRK